MRRISIRTALVISATMVLGPSARGGEPTGHVLGDWLTADGSARVRVAPCGQELCGTIVWLKIPLDQETHQPRQDIHNPDVALRGRALIGLQMLKGFKATSHDGWGGGTIYDPKAGKTYASNLGLNPAGTLKVEGCIAVFCKTQTWTPAK